MKSTINRWALESKHGDFISPDVHETLHLTGETVNDFRCREGQRVTTSPVIFLNSKKKVAETMNTLYKLGEPDPSWIEWVRVRGFSVEDYEAELNGSH